ncbi:MAG: hypothetical protein FJ207_14470 [Gemmatimonadetes bacterium]|nr:hypothetical protein [Gemmatimonadota bacterium]
MSRSSLPWMLLVLATLGCVDTAEPTGPVPIPPDDGGEIISRDAGLVAGLVDSEAEAAASRARAEPTGGK